MFADAGAVGARPGRATVIVCRPAATPVMEKRPSGPAIDFLLPEGVDTETLAPEMGWPAVVRTTPVKSGSGAEDCCARSGIAASTATRRQAFIARRIVPGSPVTKRSFAFRDEYSS